MKLYCTHAMTSLLRHGQDEALKLLRSVTPRPSSARALTCVSAALYSRFPTWLTNLPSNSLQLLQHCLTMLQVDYHQTYSPPLLLWMGRAKTPHRLPR